MHILRRKHEELLAYINSELKHGASKKKIRETLLSVGWPEHAVESVFQRIEDKKPTKAPSSPIVLRMENLTKSFGEKKVLDSVNLEIKKGEIFGIIGLSGSGKTTLLNSIIGFSRPDVGSIEFQHPETNLFSSVTKNQKAITKIFGFAPQDPSFYSRLSCEENLDHFGALYGMSSKIRQSNIDSLLSLVELAEDRKTLGKNLSGGMQRRLGIACSLIHDPHILILDEPTADLDPLMRKDVWGLIRKINKQGTTVILTSHFLSEMEGLCHRIGILHDRTIVDFGTPDELKQRFSKNNEIHLELATSDYSHIIKDIQHKEKSVKKITHEEGKIIIHTPQPEKVLHSLLHIIEHRKEKMLDIEVNKPSLREVFESFVRKKR